MSYEMSIGEIQGDRLWPDIHTSPDCYVAKQYTTIFRVSSIPCIGCKISKMCHLATLTGLVDMWSLKSGQEYKRGQQDKGH